MSFNDFLHSMAYEADLGEEMGVKTLLPLRKATEIWANDNPEEIIICCQRPSEAKVGFSTIIMPKEHLETYLSENENRREGLEVKLMGSYEDCVSFFHDFLHENGVNIR